MIFLEFFRSPLKRTVIYTLNVDFRVEITEVGKHIKLIITLFSNVAPCSLVYYTALHAGRLSHSHENLRSCIHGTGSESCPVSSFGNNRNETSCSIIDNKLIH
jgi:hypothetical protein